MQGQVCSRGAANGRRPASARPTEKSVAHLSQWRSLRPCRAPTRPFTAVDSTATPAQPPCRSSQRKRHQRSVICSAAASTTGSAPSTSALPTEADAIVVGAGVAGLAAALALQKVRSPITETVRDALTARKATGARRWSFVWLPKGTLLTAVREAPVQAGLKPLVLEASDDVGGRVRTDKVDGFLLDRGFQIFLTGYPEAQAVLDYNALDLKPFYAGALVRWSNGWHRVADPFRHPIDGILSLTNPVGSVADKINVGIFRFKSLLGTLEELLKRPEVSIREKLKAEGFSDSITAKFFRPFMGGIFFDRSLGTSSRLFEFVMRMLATGSNCLPVAGIGAVATQLAGRLPADAVRTNAKVEKVTAASGGTPASVTLSDGTTVRAARGVIVAAEGPEARRLVGGQMSGAQASKDAPGVGTACLYFSAPRPPLPGNVLYLNGEDDGIVNNACFPSEVSASYAPPGKTLCSVSTVGTYSDLSDSALESAVRSHLSQWFGKSELDTWKLIRIYRIPFAQPNQAPPTNFFRPVSLGGSLFVAGDHRDSATLDGALVSGRRAAEALLAAGK